MTWFQEDDHPQSLTMCKIMQKLSNNILTSFQARILVVPLLVAVLLVVVQVVVVLVMELIEILVFQLLVVLQHVTLGDVL